MVVIVVLIRFRAELDTDAIAVDFMNVAAVTPEETVAKPLVGNEAGQPRTKFAAENGVS
jgi:hypothetical protein